MTWTTWSERKKNIRQKVYNIRTAKRKSATTRKNPSTFRWWWMNVQMNEWQDHQQCADKQFPSISFTSRWIIYYSLSSALWLNFSVQLYEKATDCYSRSCRGSSEVLRLICSPFSSSFLSLISKQTQWWWRCQ